jgi:DNA-binding MarR family transcriptional regulator
MPPPKHELATTAWTRLFDFFIGTRWRRDQLLARLGLTPNDAKALHTLDLSAGKRMRELAEEWGTDASNATWVIDRLEDKGLAARVSLESDRRVTLVRLTHRGAKVRAEMLKKFYEPPPELLALSRAELQSLADLLGKLKG